MVPAGSPLRQVHREEGRPRSAVSKRARATLRCLDFCRARPPALSAQWDGFPAIVPTEDGLQRRACFLD
jgi:hypothetical protein